jgi:hypothetical protein
MEEMLHVWRQAMGKPDFPRRLERALALLLDALDYARDTGRDASQFAVALPELLDAETRRVDLLWLLHKGYLGITKRPSGKLTALSLTERTCFFLTTDGERFARPAKLSNGTPDFDALQRKLSFRDTVVKRFQSPAPLQERILAEFQAQGWREWIANPLSAGADGKRQLRQVVKSLNRNQHPQLIQFHSNGGNHIRWEALADEGPRNRPPTAT